MIYGNGYSLVETKAPKGYVLDPTPVYFDVNEKTVSEENGLTVVTVQKFNTVQKGRIVIEKTGEIFANVTALGGGYIDENGNDTAFPTVYQPEFATVGLAGAVFEIYADEDIVTPDGTLKAEKGELVTTITTNENGKAVSQKLYLGKYRITEKTAPYGMKRSGEDIQTELIYGGQKKELISVHISVENQRQKAKINLLKVLEQNEIFDIGNNKEINSVKFGLFADEEIKAVNGAVIPKNALLEIISCNEQGNAEFKTDIPFGKYYVREISTEEHYALSDRNYPVVFEYAGQDTETINISVNEGKEIVNKIILGTIKGLKTDRENGRAVSGALFGLFRNDVSEFTENNAVMTAVSDENGVFEFNKIPYGKYIVYELQSADGFMKNENRYPVTIAENDCIIEIKVVNDRIPKIRTTATADGKKEIGASDTFILEDEAAYEHLIPGKEYTLKGIVMDKATNQPMVINGRKIAVEKVFVPETPSGKITVRFRIHATEIKQQTDLVIFETLYDEGQKIAVHCDINDKGQTVTVKIPQIKTTATSDNQKDVTAEKEITIIDTVEYSNLIVGKEYRVSGVLMDRKTGRPLTENGKNIISETVFTAEKENGEVTVKFVFDASVITEDTEVVVFEALYSNNKEIAVHCDINDKNQTITIHPAKKPEIERPKTGDDNRLGMLFGMAESSLVCILSAILFRKRKWNNQR